MKKFLYWLWRVLPLPMPIRYLALWLGNRKFVIGVVALVLNAEGEVLLFRHSYRTETPWGFPGGYLRKNETPEKAIQREIFEESGFKVSIIKLLEVVISQKTPLLSVLFLGELQEEVVFNPSDEVNEASFFAIDELPELISEHKEIIKKYATEMGIRVSSKG